MNSSYKPFAIILVPFILILGVMWNYFALNTSNRNHPNNSLETQLKNEKLMQQFKIIADNEHHQLVIPNKKLASEEKEKIEMSQKILTYTLNDINKISASDIEQIKKAVRLSPEYFSDFLKLELKNAQKSNDILRESNIYGIAAILPLGKSTLIQDSENVLFEQSNDKRPFNETLFKNAYQLYLIQASIQQEDTDRFTNELITNSVNENTKLEVKKAIEDVSGTKATKGTL